MPNTIIYIIPIGTKVKFISTDLKKNLVGTIEVANIEVDSKRTTIYYEVKSKIIAKSSNIHHCSPIDIIYQYPNKD